MDMPFDTMNYILGFDVGFRVCYIDLLESDGLELIIGDISCVY